MRVSRYFLTTLKEAPAEAELASHRLMLRAGMIKRLSAGIYTWLPLGLRVVDLSGALRLRGVMAVAPLGAPAEPAFERLAALAAELRAGYPEATEISAGMSADLEEAISCGATRVRIGSSVLGPRPSIQ